MPKQRSQIEAVPWAQAVVGLGLDHPALMRLSSTRNLMEDAHKVHEQRRSLRGRIESLQTQLSDLLKEEDAATAVGLELLEHIRVELEGYTADLVDLSGKLRTSLTVSETAGAEPTRDGADTFVARHSLREQYDNLLDMFSAFGAFDLRARAIRFHGRSGRMHELPSFESIVTEILTDDVRAYLQNAERVRLLITPAADQRVFTGVGKTLAFNNYAVSGVGSEGPEACADFVSRVRGADSGDTVVDELLKRTQFDGLRVSLYSESGGGRSQAELRGQGLGIDTICEDITANTTDAADHGVDARPLTPPEYLLLQAIRRRFGHELLDTESGSAGRIETWFPSHQVTGAPGTLVARSVGTGLRFRADELGRGAEGRGYRMAYAPVAA